MTESVHNHQQLASYSRVVISYDPPKTGNCQFEAIADQLSTKTASEKMATLMITRNFVREKVIEYMERFPTKFINFQAENKWTE